MTETSPIQRGWQRYNCRTGSVVFINPAACHVIEYDPAPALYFVGEASFVSVLDAMAHVTKIEAPAA